MRIFRRRQTSDERGQSLTELAIGLPFVILIIIGIVEMGLVFATYVSMINAAREGAMFASIHPELTDPGNDADLVYPSSAGTTNIWDEYQNRIRAEVFTLTTETLRQNQLLTEDEIIAERPEADLDGYGDPDLTPGKPIRVTVVANLSTFSSNISLPFFGRFGLPNRYRVEYTFEMPIR